MTTKETKPLVQAKNTSDKEAAWYDIIIDVFKKLLEYNYTSYGTKKQF